MDNNFNPQTNGNPNQQGNPYQQGTPYQQGNPYQQGTPYQQGMPNQQANPYMNNGYGNYGASPEPQKAPNIFEQFGLSFVPPQYNRLTKVSTGSMIGFVTLLALVATVIMLIYLAIGFTALDVKEWANKLPDFEIKDGRMYLEEDFLFDEGEVFVYLTEDISEFSFGDASELAEEGYRNIILVGRDRLSLMQNGQYQQIDFNRLGSGEEISRDLIVDTLVSMLTVMIVLGCIIFFVGRVFWYFLCAAVYLVFALIIASIMKKQLPAGELFRTAVYSKVLMFVVATLLSVIPVGDLSVPFLLRVILRVVITVVFMAFAIAKLPDNRPAPITVNVGPGMGQGWQ